MHPRGRLGPGQDRGIGINPDFHGLIPAFDRLTGCPSLLSTSFNRAGEPMVASPSDALATAVAAMAVSLVIYPLL